MTFTMRLSQGLVVLLCVLTLVCVVQSKKRKSRAGKGDWRMARFQRLVSPMQEEIKQLQRAVGRISNPVHIHLHGVSGVGEQSELVLRDGDDPDHHSPRDDHSHHEHKHGHHEHKHGHHRRGSREHHKRGSHEHHRRGSRERRGGKSSRESRGSEEQEGDSSEEEDDDDDDHDEGPNQSHVHIHVNVAGGGRGGETCPTPCGGPNGNEYIFAYCHVIPNPALEDRRHEVRGSVYLRQKRNGPIEVKVNVEGLDTRSDKRRYKLHGFHVHELADFSLGCNSFGGHYNPRQHAHGGPESDHKHAGDWGNLEADNRGRVIASFNQSGYLYGPESIMGRGIVIHAQEDDHGKGGTQSSQTTGSAGARIGCCVIGHCKGGNW